MIDKEWKKIVLILFFVISISLVCIIFGFSENNMPTVVPEIMVEYKTEKQSTVIINSDLRVNGNLEANKIKSKTTDALIITNVIFGAIILILIF